MLEKIQKFFTPLTSFLPHFFSFEVWSNFTFKTHIYRYSDVKKRGSIEGVKNFCIIKCKHLTFLLTLNRGMGTREGQKPRVFSLPFTFLISVRCFCDMTLIFSPTQITRLGAPFKYLEHVRRVHKKISRSIGKKSWTQKVKK